MLLGARGLGLSELMKNVSSIYWAAFSVLTAFTACEKRAPESILAGPPEVLVTEVVEKEVPVIRQWVGTVNGIQNAEVRARTEGYLTTISYQQGGYVKQGDVLFQIDSRPGRHCRTAGGANWRPGWYRGQFGFDDGVPDQSDLVLFAD